MEEFWLWLASTELAFQIGATWWFPLLESIHVIGVALLVGPIVMADLRLLGIAGVRYEVERFVRELLPWVWTGFGMALVTGAGMFISRPDHYAANAAFQIKLVLLILAGVNAFVLHRSGYRYAEDKANVGAVSSIVFWLGIVLSGRWIGHL